MRLVTRYAVIVLLIAAAAAQSQTSSWRPATEAELQSVIPARAPVEKERIETEMRTASGVVNGRKKLIAGVVIITAGYSADGKYSHYFITQVPVTIGNVKLVSGEYVFGYRRAADGDSLTITFYEAATGKELGSAEAKRSSDKGRIASFKLTPRRGGGTLELGRFAVNYSAE
jgi:hypothetical protein